LLADTDEYDVNERLAILFHVDEVFTKSDYAATISTNEMAPSSESTFVLSGHLRCGNLSIGDQLYIGPFTIDTTYDGSRLEMHRARSLPRQTSGSPRSFTPTQLRQRPLSGNYSSADLQEDSNASTPKEWQLLRVVSIRNLRLPVRRLLAGQVGTIGIEFEQASTFVSSKPRKGMVLARTASGQLDNSLKACSGFKALFDDADYLFMEPGQLFSTYIASIRASAKIVSVEAVTEALEQDLQTEGEDIDDIFGFDESDSHSARASGKQPGRVKKLIEVTFRFVTYREWIEIGTQVLVMPGSGAEGSVGLEGFVGRITYALE